MLNESLMEGVVPDDAPGHPAPALVREQGAPPLRPFLQALALLHHMPVLFPPDQLASLFFLFSGNFNCDKMHIS